MYSLIGIFIVNCRYLRIKLRRQLKRLTSLADAITRLHQYRQLFASTAEFEHQLAYLQRQFFRVNRAIHRVRLDIASYSRFWARYLSVIFCTLTIVCTYFVYIVLMVLDKDGVFEIAFFVFLGVILSTMLFTITYECSVLANLNSRLARLQSKLGIHLSSIRRVDLIVQLKVKALLALICSLRTKPDALNYSLINRY